MKNNLLKKYGRHIVKVAFKIAEVEANTACPYFGYQRQLPKEVKKLRKF